MKHNLFAPVPSRSPSATTWRRDLEAALKTDPGFSATGVAEIRRLLDALP